MLSDTCFYVVSCWNLYNSLWLLLFSHARFPWHLRIIIQIPLNSSASLNPTNGSYGLPRLILSSPSWFCIHCKRASIVSTWSSSTSGSSSLSAGGYHWMQCGLRSILLRMYFTSKLDYWIHPILNVPCAPGTILAGRSSWYTNVLLVGSPSKWTRDKP